MPLLTRNVGGPGLKRSSLEQGIRDLSSPAALSPWVWIQYSPVPLLGTLLVVPQGSPTSAYVKAEVAGATSLLVLAVLAYFSLIALRPLLNRSIVGGLAVCAAWTVMAVAYSTVQAEVQEYLGLPSRAILETPAWWCIKAALLIVGALLLSQRRDLVVDERIAAEAVKAETLRLAELEAIWTSLTTGVSEYLGQGVLPTLYKCRDELERSDPDDVPWQRIGSEFERLATGPIRSLSHTIANTEVSTSGAGATALSDENDLARLRAPRASRFISFLRQYPVIRPVTIFPACLLIPLQLQLWVTGDSDLLLPSFMVAAFTAAIAAIAAFTRSARYRRYLLWQKWLLVLGSQVLVCTGFTYAGFVLKMTLLGTLTSTGQTTLAQGIITLVWVVVATNFAIGYYAAALHNRRERIAVQNSLAVLRSTSRDALRKQEQELRRELASQLHALAQGRLVALSLLAKGVAAGQQAPARARALLASELDSFLPELSSIADLREGVSAMQAIDGPLAEIVDVWQQVMPTTVESVVAPGVSMVPSSLATAVGRVAAEALANAAKHSGATACAIKLVADIDEGLGLVVELSVADNGRPTSNVITTGAGLGMSEINKYSDGRWELKPNSAGNTLTATLQ